LGVQREAVDREIKESGQKNMLSPNEEKMIGE
jgi:hypothetical protein